VPNSGNSLEERLGDRRTNAGDGLQERIPTAQELLRCGKGLHMPDKHDMMTAYVEL
jgi:hypothetical protein